ncbi:uncharacterized protein N7459_007808 [Penicillium hispanicum]|uniref:uncharacterized protein n=1 Tax=Penicillium hispanicum TaxID=1080232 RepID=UPI0025417B3E|nr:uncharacterized protein N7459_007808 [Penicillium hispanicum]KAJ5573381.1 hypothetical protein N7459_007808 [Penicillium hispanicum]
MNSLLPDSRRRVDIYFFSYTPYSTTVESPLYTDEGKHGVNTTTCTYNRDNVELSWPQATQIGGLAEKKSRRLTYEPVVNQVLQDLIDIASWDSPTSQTIPVSLNLEDEETDVVPYTRSTPTGKSLKERLAAATWTAGATTAETWISTYEVRTPKTISLLQKITSPDGKTVGYWPWNKEPTYTPNTDRAGDNAGQYWNDQTQTWRYDSDLPQASLQEQQHNAELDLYSEILNTVTIWRQG